MLRLGQRARVGSSRPARRSPPSPAPLPLGVPPSLCGPGARLCTFLTRPAGLSRERQLGWREPRRGAWGPEPPRRFRGPGAPLDLGPGGGLRCSDWRPWRGAGCAVLGWRLLAPRSGSRPAHGAEEAKGELGLESAALGEKNSALKFQGGFSFLVGKLFVQVRRAVLRFCYGRELRWTPKWSDPRLHGRLLFVSLILRVLSTNLRDLLNFTFNPATASSHFLVLKNKSLPLHLNKKEPKESFDF